MLGFVLSLLLRKKRMHEEHAAGRQAFTEPAVRANDLSRLDRLLDPELVDLERTGAGGICTTLVPHIAASKSFRLSMKNGEILKQRVTNFSTPTPAWLFLLIKVKKGVLRACRRDKHGMPAAPVP